MLSFDSIWDLVKNHGGVAEFYITDAARLWETYSEPQREHIYRAIQNKLAAGKFVHYNPVKAFVENAPKKTFQGPTNYQGRKLPAVPVFSAKWQGKWGMYTIEDIKKFNMEIAAQK